jgi:hypothetical protein
MNMEACQIRNDELDAATLLVEKPCITSKLLKIGDSHCVLMLSIAFNQTHALEEYALESSHRSNQNVGIFAQDCASSTAQEWTPHL